jgi:hypothetical protein
MTSGAYKAWQQERARRLQGLFDAHTAVGGANSGRRWKTEQINWAVVLLLAAEFQGYARDLHNEAAEVFATEAASGNQDLEAIIRTRLTQNRQLDRGNAQPASLDSDFMFFGCDLWGDLAGRWPMKKQSWHGALTELNEARNAIAHSHDGKIKSLTVDLKAVRRWRASLDGLAVRMDDVVARHLETVLGTQNPWGSEEVNGGSRSLQVGDIVKVYQGFWARALVIEVYRSIGGDHAVVRVPVEQEQGVEPSTFSYPIDRLTSAVPFKEGDIVRVCRGFWERARVIEVYKGPRGYHAVVQVPVEYEPGVEPSTFSYSVDDLTLVA